MRILLNSVTVNDQTRALNFYTEILGFQKKTEIPMGEHRWLTVVSPQDPEGTELLLEPNAFAPAVVYQKALFEAGIPATSFSVDDIDAEHKRLDSAGVKFKQEPTEMGPVKMAVFEDTCGNLIQIYQQI